MITSFLQILNTGFTSHNFFKSQIITVGYTKRVMSSFIEKVLDRLLFECCRITCPMIPRDYCRRVTRSSISSFVTRWLWSQSRCRLVGETKSNAPTIGKRFGPRWIGRDSGIITLSAWSLRRVPLYIEWNSRLATVQMRMPAWASAVGAKRVSSPIEIGIRNQKFLENLKSSSLFWCHAVMSL